MSLSTTCYLPISLIELVESKCLKKINTDSSTFIAESNNLSSNSVITNVIGSNSSTITCDGGVNGGSSPIIAISSISSDLYGRISISVGSSPSGTELVRINLTRKYTFCCTHIYPFNSTLANNFDTYSIVDNSGSNTIIRVFLNSTTSQSQQIIFNYIIFGK